MTTAAASLTALASITLLAAGFGQLARKLRQPPVMGEMVAGIVLGPSVLGALSPSLQEVLLPAQGLPFLAAAGLLGIVLFLFVTGMEMDTDAVFRQPKNTLLIALSGMVLPFVLGIAAATWLFATYAPTGVAQGPFVSFFGAALSVTAFPVLARILKERELLQTQVGKVVLAAAGLGDLLAWVLLAVLSGFATANLAGPATVVGSLLVYAAVMGLVVRPLLARLVLSGTREHGNASAPPSHRYLPVLLGGLFLSAAATSYIGVHPLFGAFAFGTIVPRQHRLPERIAEQLDTVVSVVLLPAFFALAGTKLHVGQLTGVQDWLVCGGILVLATVGKFLGTQMAARLGGMAWRDASLVGVLMNTRGLMELIVLNIGLELGVLSNKLYTMLVLMALVTTFATGPLVHWLQDRAMHTKG
jgi:Kef-type K+ transport system membrane component KefB